ncbi:MAG: hypothetical protein GVY36_08970 [Verrucomicrobia bacterium]|jgi:hypothetical protein|nr:hypothetical protein [Verrucomicrobiota bacterium]
MLIPPSSLPPSLVELWRTGKFQPSKTLLRPPRTCGFALANDDPQGTKNQEPRTKNQEPRSRAQGPIKCGCPLISNEPEDYLEAWQSVDSGEGVPLAVAKRVFGEDPKAVIEELNTALIA